MFWDYVWEVALEWPGALGSCLGTALGMHIIGYVIMVQNMIIHRVLLYAGLQYGTTHYVMKFELTICYDILYAALYDGMVWLHWGSTCGVALEWPAALGNCLGSGSGVGNCIGKLPG